MLKPELSSAIYNLYFLLCVVSGSIASVDLGGGGNGGDNISVCSSVPTSGTSCGGLGGSSLGGFCIRIRTPCGDVGVGGWFIVSFSLLIPRPVSLCVSLCVCVCVFFLFLAARKKKNFKC